MFESVLIANRGEIASRIARTAKKLEVWSIAVYSDADRSALHVRLCDEAHRLGPARASESYLAIDRVIDVAKRTGAQCVHPGYGFLAENAEFAEACAAAGIVFVGPPPAAIRAMGLKDKAKALMERAGVPVVPGYHGERQDPDFLRRNAAEIGYPVLIKAVAGGGGKGMRRVYRAEDFADALASAVRELQSAFGDGRVLIEKYIETPRHVEMQVFADRDGRTIHLGERDCSLQRRHQKVIEEAPAPGMTAALRETMGRAAIEAARAVGYVGAGTVEFITDGSRGLRSDAFWFMEMNTRLQVEHPVTESITGLDLVEWQLRIAAGEPLPPWSGELQGHAIEARLYSEDPERNFLPSTGRIVALELPRGPGIRVDDGVAAGDEVTPFYDPLMAKVIAHGSTREEARQRLASALAATRVAGPRTNAAFLAALSGSDAFRNAQFDTGFIERNLGPLGAVPREPDRAAAAAGIAELLAVQARRTTAKWRGTSEESFSPWDADDAFQLGGKRVIAFPVMVDHAPAEARAIYVPDGVAVDVDGTPAARDAIVIEAAGVAYVLRNGRQTVVRMKDFEAIDPDELDAHGVIHAPMHGKVLSVLARAGDKVRKGQRLAVIEAMKMEHALLAPTAGTIAKVSVWPGEQVAEGAAIISVEPAEEERRVTLDSVRLIR